MLRRYAQLAGDSLQSTESVFRSVYKTTNGKHLLRAGSKLSFSRARQIFIQKFQAIGLEATP